MSVSLFSPIYQNSFAEPLENLGFLRVATHFFDFGQKAYTIQSIDNSATFLSAVERNKPSWFAIAIRIAAILTVVIPLLMLIGIAIYRAANFFQQKEAGIQKLGLNMLHKCFTLANESDEDKIDRISMISETLVLFDEEVALVTARSSHGIKPFLRTLIAISKDDPIRALSMADIFFQSDKSKEAEEDSKEFKPIVMALIAKNLAPQFPEKAFDIVKCILESLDGFEADIKDTLAKCLATIAITNPFYLDKTIKITSKLNDQSLKETAFSKIARGLAPQDPDRAILLANRIDDAYAKNDSLANIAKTIAFSDIKSAILLANTITDQIMRIEVLVDSAKAFMPLNGDAAIEVIEFAFTLASSIEDFIDRRDVYCKIAEFGAAIIPKKGLEIVNRVVALVLSMSEKQDGYVYSIDDTLAKIAKYIAEFDPERAFEVVNLISVRSVIKRTAFGNVAKKMAPLNPKRALEVARSIPDIRGDNLKARVLAGIIKKVRSSDKIFEVIKEILSIAEELDADSKIQFYLKAARGLHI